ncbi:hypothetical protein VP01_3115g3 [Puccinia sorghi]|uniref:Uncharacterized protein n=1 Tax=Puccinia sorghi TaxID=27349 RepID=A0A0L6UZA6_9BASI|nr:hypothetical protein VP01_3115g3 [Puccinia sorghi]
MPSTHDLALGQSGSSQPLRLPSIQLPSHVDFSRNYPPTRFSTCPSLHQHHSGKDATPTSETMLRKFFARSDDISISPFHPGAPAEGRWPDGVLTPRNQAAPQTSGGHFRRVSHSQQTYHSNGGHTEEHEQTIFMAGGSPKTYSSHVGSSTRADEPRHVDVEERIWQDQLQNGSFTNLVSPKALQVALSMKKGKSIKGSFIGEYELNPRAVTVIKFMCSSVGFKCETNLILNVSQCGNFELGAGNRKCKSQASYLKHRSMMCTHRLGKACSLSASLCDGRRKKESLNVDHLIFLILKSKVLSLLNVGIVKGIILTQVIFNDTSWSAQKTSPFNSTLRVNFGHHDSQVPSKVLKRISEVNSWVDSIVVHRKMSMEL